MTDERNEPSSNTATPRTDAAVMASAFGPRVTAEFARTLEREVSALKSENSVLGVRIIDADQEVSALRERVKVLEGARDILREHNIRLEELLRAVAIGE